jgi:hypothetical protein
MLDSRILELMSQEVQAGVKEADSQYITDAESRQAWKSLESTYQSLKNSNIVMAIPAEWDNADYQVDDLYDDGFFEQFAEEPMQKMSLVSKSVNEDRYTLGPMYIPDSLDAHGEWTDSEELQKSVWDYVRKNDRRIRLQHNKDVVAGEWVEVMAWPYEVSVPMQKADGSMQDTLFPKDTVFLGVVWEPWAWEMIKAGNLRGYSIGGRAQRLEVDLPLVKDDAGATVSGPTVNTVHVDTVMSGQKKKPKKDVKVSEEDVSN